MAIERLDKLLASQGIGSRKEVSRLIRDGRVKVNETIQQRPEYKVDPQQDTMAVDGEPIRFQRYLYLMMNKPRGVVSASKDPKCPTVIDLVPSQWRRRGLFPAGRLDKDTEGLLIITDDGEFAHQMLSPKKKIYKLYEAKVKGTVGDKEIAQFQEGIVFADGVQCLPAELTVVGRGEATVAQVKICEGKFHQVKKMFLAVGCEVIQLKRLKIGELSLDTQLNPGECREIVEIERKLALGQAISTK